MAPLRRPMKHPMSQLTILAMICFSSLSAFSADHEIRGSYRLDKGTRGCSMNVSVESTSGCDGLALRAESSSSNKNSESYFFCNINNGKFIRKWTESGKNFFSESISKQNKTLYFQNEIVKIQQGKVWNKKSEQTTSVFFRAGRLELQKLNTGRATTCLYSRTQGFPLTAEIK